MTKLRLSHFEKVAGLFIVGGVSLIILSWFFAALKQGWLETRSTYYAKFPSGEGLYSGLDVLLSGIRVGSVTKVELLDSNEVKVEFTVLSKYADKIRQDSRALLIRPFVLGEKALEITLGSRNLPILEPDSELKVLQTFDVMSLLSGRMGGDFAHLGNTLNNLAKVVVQLLDRDKLEGLIKTIDRIDSLLNNLDVMSKEVATLSRQLNRNENLRKLVRDLANLSYELNNVMPELKNRAPLMADNFERLVENMATLSEQFKVIGPAIVEVGPELPQATRRALEALDETVVILKALQRSFILKGHADDVREEENNNKKRQPTQEK